jgi:hypothetical protein
MDSTHSTEDAPANSPWYKRRAYGIAILALIICQLSLILYFEPPSIIFSAEPNSWLDYDTHIEQTWRAIEAMDVWGKSWSYDPHLLAGNPNGTVFAADNKGWDLWTFTLWKLGVPKGMAFNLFILLAHLMVPWIVLVSARLFDLDRWSALIAAWLGMFLWYFDAFPRWTWWCGMVAYGIAGYFVLLPLGLFYKYLKEKRKIHLLLLAMALSAVHLIHPYAFVILVVPMLTFYFLSRKQLLWRHHMGVFGVALFVIAVNSYWLIPAIKFWPYMAIAVEDGVYAQSSPAFILSDYLGLLKDPMATGFMLSCTGFRFICFIGGTLCLISWRKNRDSRFLPFALGIGALLCITYFLGSTALFTYIQPYRHIMPAMYLATIPAAAFLGQVRLEKPFAKTSWLTLALLGLGIMLVFSNLAREVIYFFPNLLPDPNLSAEDVRELQRVNPDVTGVTNRQMFFRHKKTFPDFNAIARALKNHDDGSGRVLVEWEILGEHLAWRTDSQILGGFRLRNLQHAYSNLFRRYDEGPITREQAREHLIDYAIRWAIFSGPRHELESYTELMKPIGVIPPAHRIYETKVPVSFFALNNGQVKATLNRLAVTGTNPKEDVVLRYHFLDTFVCNPDCQVQLEPIKYNPVGFIRVPAPHPADFVIENGY